MTDDQPIEQLAARVVRGEIDLAHARALAADRAVTSKLTLEYAREVARNVQHFLGRHNVNPAFLIANLLRTAIETIPDDEANAALHTVGDLTWIRAVTASLPGSPDWNLYCSARDAGARLLKRARRQRDAQAIRWTHGELGELHFQVLATMTIGGSAPEGRWNVWYDEGNAAASEVTPYPRPAAAFGRAYRHFGRAAFGADGADRATSLKGQIQALDWQGRTTGAPQVDLMAAIAGDALAEPDVAADPVSATYLMGIRQQAGHEIDAAVFQRVMSVPIEDLIGQIGPFETVSTYLNLASIIRPTDARLALALIERVAPAVTVARDSTVMVRYSNTLIATLVATMFDETIDNSAGTSAAAQQVLRRAEVEDWSPARVAGALLSLVVECARRNEEGEGLRLLLAAEQIFPDPFNAYPAAMNFWRVSLWSGEGVNRARNGDLGASMNAYANALRFALPLGLPDFATHQLRYLVDVGMRGADQLLLPLIGIMFEIGLDLEIALGADGVELLQNLTTGLTEHQALSGEVNTNMLHFTWQIAKARRFGAAMRTGAARALAEDQVMDDLASRIAALRSEVPLDEEGNAPGRRLDRTRLLLSFAVDQTPTSGASKVEELINLQARFDQRLERNLAQLSTAREPELIGLEDLRASLDERTAFLQLYLGELKGQRAVFAMLVARAGESISATPSAEGLMIEFVEQGRSNRAYSYEEDVFLVREALLDENLDAEGLMPWLHAAGGAFLHGGLGTGLDNLRAAGCDHLVVVPHGPYHLAPLHLFARDSRLLADEWTVTVLPVIESMTTRPEEAAERDGLAAFGMSFTKTNPFDLPELSEAADEAKRVAKALQGIAKVDDEVTEDAVLDALSKARYIHLATHGAMNLDAPSFQYVVVTETETDDGLLHAHELMRLDLRGVRLVTLSACETALGRIDRADNPRGLPAALLLAGAETIVGTLWEVDNDAARAFFVELYRGLAASLSRRDAFRRAQTEVRRRFPHPRDWGAFFFMGAWS
jgi:hypothetical protein